MTHTPQEQESGWSDHEGVGGGGQERTGGLEALAEVTSEQFPHFTSYEVISVRLQLQQSRQELRGGHHDNTH